MNVVLEPTAAEGAALAAADADAAGEVALGSAGAEAAAVLAGSDAAGLVLVDEQAATTKTATIVAAIARRGAVRLPIAE